MHPLDYAALAGRALVLLLLASRKAVSRVRLGMGVYGRRDRRFQPAGILPLSCLPDFVCRRRVIWSRCWLDRQHWIKLVYPALVAVAGAVLAPHAIPVLPPETYICVHEGAALSAARDRDAQTRPSAAIICRPVRLGGDGGHCSAVYHNLLQIFATRRQSSARTTGRLEQSICSVRIRLATRHQRAPELLPLGTARLHRRKRHRHGGAPAELERRFMQRAKGRQRLSPLLHALPAFRRLLLPRP